MAATFPSVVTVASVSRERTEGVCQRPGQDAKEGLPPPAPRMPLHRSGSVARRAGCPEPPRKHFSGIVVTPLKKNTVSSHQHSPPGENGLKPFTFCGKKTIKKPALKKKKKKPS